MNSKILIIGFGSIGQRHYKNLKKIGYKNLWIYDKDKSKVPGLAKRSGAGKSQNSKLANINLDVLRQFKIVFICSPNNWHIQHALLAAQAGCHLFIEKPLSHKLKDIDKLYKICKQQNLFNFVACNMRFHPCLKFIKKYLEQKNLGKVYSINHNFGYYLPYWRPGTDYRKNYAAKKSMGGGIILDDIHEFDLLFWLNNFSPIKDYKFIYDKVSNLKIETEDICFASFKFKNNVIGLVQSDYLQQNYTRNCKIVGEYGNLEWDFNQNIVWLKNKQGSKKLFHAKNYNLNQMYIDELKYFMSCLKNKKKTFNDIQTAKQVLKYCLKR